MARCDPSKPARPGRFDALAFLGMNAVAVKKFDFSGGRSGEGLDETAVLEANAHRATMIDHFDRQSVEELVAEDDDALCWRPMRLTPANRRPRTSLPQCVPPNAPAISRADEPIARPERSAVRRRNRGNCLADQSSTSRAKSPRPGPSSITSIRSGESSARHISSNCRASRRPKTA